MRNAFAETIYELAKEDERICVLVADISPAGAMEKFRADFPDRFFNVGVAEQAMIGLAAGIAQRGLKVFCYTIATFALFRPYEFIRCDLAYQNLPVTVVGMGAGLSYSTLGGTHQAVEDVAVAMACPNMTVLAPSDPWEVGQCVRWCASRGAGGPAYMRIGKVGERDLGGRTPDWGPGRLRVVRHDDEADVLVLSYGPIAREALTVAEVLGAEQAAVCALAPQEMMLEVAREAASWDRVIVIEEAAGGPLAGALRVMCPKTEIISFALPRAFTHRHGSREELLEHHGLTAEKMLKCLREYTT